MKKFNVLYISGAVGLGHINRDLAIVYQLRKLLPQVEIEWLAAHPVTVVLEEAGEKLVSGADQFANENVTVEKAAKGTSLNGSLSLLKTSDEWEKNSELFLKLVTAKKYDLIIGDETYEIYLTLKKHRELKKFPFVMIFDVVGLDAVTKNPLEHLIAYYWNRVWSDEYRHKQKPPFDLGLFVGELNDVPDKSFGFMLPNRRKYAEAFYTFIGYVFPFDVTQFSDKHAIREKLGYGDEPLLICSIGGTAIGKEQLELCGKACIIAKERIPNLHVVIVTGPRLSANTVNLPKGIEVKGFVPRLYEHFAACDLAITQGGAASTFELTALRKPFIYFPIEEHFEQASVSRILTQRGAGVKLRLAKTSSEILADEILKNIGKNVVYPDIPKDGAQKAAQLIVNLLEQYTEKT
jgi:UDP:flavonoid glycosyltransferase YjiC (YdhE family)